MKAFPFITPQMKFYDTNKIQKTRIKQKDTSISHTHSKSLFHPSTHQEDPSSSWLLPPRQAPLKIFLLYFGFFLQKTCTKAKTPS
ncbi:protein of unknown function [Alcaligenes faecalis subsp. faecalis]|nr:protein of unknown function [Alcaligenes faecalis subsp. faecalis]